MSQELKPCPFCGSGGKMIRPMGERVFNRDAAGRAIAPFYGPDWFRVTCSNTDCHCFARAYADAAEAITAWNTRARPSADPELKPTDWVIVPREPTEAMLEAQFGQTGPAACYAAMLAAAPRPSADADAAGVDWRDDMASDERWNAGVNFAIEQLCGIFGVDPKSINWDAATETLDGDVSSVLCNVLVAAYGEEWSSYAPVTAAIRSTLVASQPPAPVVTEQEPPNTGIDVTGFYRKCGADTPGAEWGEGIGYYVHDEQARIEGQSAAKALTAALTTKGES